jgi:DNA-binding HxlR family transcriptional regulator
MGTIKMKIRIIKLKRQIKKCDSKIVKLRLRSIKYHNIILRKIINGDDELSIDKLKLEREFDLHEICKLTDRKYSLINQLIEA